jgi:hypothetical protein
MIFELRRRRAAGEERGEARAETDNFELRRRRAAGEERGEARAEIEKAERHNGSVS